MGKILISTQESETIFNSCKTELEEKIAYLQHLKINPKHNPVYTSYKDFITQVGQHRIEVINLVDSFYNKFIQNLNSQLVEFETELSNITIESINSRVHNLIEDTLHQTKRVKTEPDTTSDLFERRTSLIKDLSDTIDFKTIYNNKLDENKKMLSSKKVALDQLLTLQKTQKIHKPELTVTLEPKDPKITCIREASRDTLVSCSSNEIKIWDRNRLEPIKSLCLEGIRSSCILPIDQNSNEIIAAYVDGSIKVWDMQCNKCTKVNTCNKIEITCLEILNENQFLSGSINGKINVWNKTSGKLDRVSHVHTSRINSILKYMLEKAYVVSGSTEGLIHIFNPVNGVIFTQFRQANSVLCLEKLESKNLLFSGSIDGSIKIWCMSNKRNLGILNSHNRPILCIKMIDEEQLMSYSTDSSVKLWDLNAKNCVKTSSVNDKSLTCGFIGNDKSLVFGKKDGQLQVVFPFK